MASFATAACVDYTGMKTPYPVGLYLDIAGLDIASLTDVTLCNVRTGCCEKPAFAKGNYYQFELSNLPSTNPMMPNWFFSDEIKVTLCSGNPACVQSFHVGDPGFESMGMLHVKIESQGTSPEPIIISECDPANPNIPEKCTVIKDDNVKVTIVEKEVTVKELGIWGKLGWFAGFLGIIGFLVGIGKYFQAKKTIGTMVDKARAGKYK